MGRNIVETSSSRLCRPTFENERAFLAWIRTALDLLAAGVALEALRLGGHPGFRLAAPLPHAPPSLDHRWSERIPRPDGKLVVRTRTRVGPRLSTRRSWQS
ncbi:DUF202 domain-containing protein [Microbacteriaceae bacterium VKM Ac-2855]|nr:DUF202 domain-containing protein [Microbacteriaceae bacterium VKM Ac-2855]